MDAGLEVAVVGVQVLAESVDLDGPSDAVGKPDLRRSVVEVLLKPLNDALQRGAQEGVEAYRVAVDAQVDAFAEALVEATSAIGPGKRRGRGNPLARLEEMLLAQGREDDAEAVNFAGRILMQSAGYLVAMLNVPDRELDETAAQALDVVHTEAEAALPGLAWHTLAAVVGLARKRDRLPAALEQHLIENLVDANTQFGAAMLGVLDAIGATGLPELEVA